LLLDKRSEGDSFTRRQALDHGSERLNIGFSVS
jgi:hypothetical protein